MKFGTGIPDGQLRPLYNLHTEFGTAYTKQTSYTVLYETKNRWHFLLAFRGKLAVEKCIWLYVRKKLPFNHFKAYISIALTKAFIK